MATPKRPRPKRIVTKAHEVPIARPPRVSSYDRYLKYCRQIKSHNTRPIDYIMHMEKMLGHEPRTKYWRFARSRLAALMVEVWEETGSYEFMNYRHFQVFLYICRHMSLANDLQYWPGELCEKTGVNYPWLMRVLNSLEKRGVITRYKPRGGWVRAWVGVNHWYYGYQSEKKQCAEMWERIQRREAKAKSKDSAFKRQIRKQADREV